MDYLNQKQKELTQAKEMVDNGLAENVDDALHKIRNNEHLSDPNRPTPEPQSLGSNSSSSSSHPSVDATETKADESSSELAQIKDFLTRFDKFFSDFYHSTQQKMQTLCEDVEEIKKQVAQLKESSPPPLSGQTTLTNVPPHSPTPSGVSSQASSSAPFASLNSDASSPSPTPAQAASSSGAQGSPRSGNYNSTDVSIEQIFSNSNNKMMRK